MFSVDVAFPDLCLVMYAVEGSLLLTEFYDCLDIFAVFTFSVIVFY